MTTYQKEVWITIGLSLLFLISGHMGLFFSMFPTEGYFLGFPAKYIVPIIVGWLGVFLLTILAKYLGNYLDDEIERENQEGHVVKTDLKEGEE